MHLERSPERLLWDLRGLWARDVPVVLTLAKPPAQVERVVGRIQQIAVTGAFVMVDGWHVPLQVILRADRATIEVQLTKENDMKDKIEEVLQTHGMSAADISGWWDRPNPFLQNARPIIVLEKDPDSAYGAALALVNGVYS